MDRSKFLTSLRASRVRLQSLSLPGWDEPIYLKPPTVADVKESMLRAASQADAPDRDVASVLRDDPYFLARQIARVVRDVEGALLFDAADDAQMAELMEALADTAPTISRLINDAYNRLGEPADGDTHEGN